MIGIALTAEDIAISDYEVISAYSASDRQWMSEFGSIDYLNRQIGLAVACVTFFLDEIATEMRIQRRLGNKLNAKRKK